MHPARFLFQPLHHSFRSPSSLLWAWCVSNLQWHDHWITSTETGCSMYYPHCYFAFAAVASCAACRVRCGFLSLQRLLWSLSLLGTLSLGTHFQDYLLSTNVLTIIIPHSVRPRIFGLFIAYLCAVVAPLLVQNYELQLLWFLMNIDEHTPFPRRYSLQRVLIKRINYLQRLPAYVWVKSDNVRLHSPSTSNAVPPADVLVNVRYNHF